MIHNDRPRRKFNRFAQCLRTMPLHNRFAERLGITAANRGGLVGACVDDSCNGLKKISRADVFTALLIAVHEKVSGNSAAVWSADCHWLSRKRLPCLGGKHDFVGLREVAFAWIGDQYKVVSDKRIEVRAADDLHITDSLR